MDIFGSLENLPVSEECFDDIMNMVEKYINETAEQAIVKKHGKPKYYEYTSFNGREATPMNRAAELMNSLWNSRTKQGPYIQTSDAKNVLPRFRKKTDKQAVEASIARNKAKQEKKNK
jgi:hypothetical protein